MYNLLNIKEIHLEITSKCQASCPMCPRNILGGVVNPWLEETEITIHQFKEWFPINFIKQLDRIFVCGNLGDGIVAKDTLTIFEFLRETNPDIKLALHTNGSAQTKKWWEKLAFLKVQVTFGIDGLVDTHHLYRIGTDWNKIIENAKTFIQAGGDANWHMLVFDHNKHQVLECEKLSKELGFIEFKQKNSSRFRGDFMPVLDKQGKTIYKIYPSEKSSQITNKMFSLDFDDNVNISCKAKNNNSIYVSANGDITPCCWLNYTGINPVNVNTIDYKDNNFINPNLKKNTLDEIFNSNYFFNIEKTWDCNSLRECKKQCGKIDKLNEQFK